MVNIPSMKLHAFRNPTTSDVRVLITCTPNLGRFFADAGPPFERENPYRHKVPSPEQIQRVVEISARYGHVYSDDQPGNCKRGPGQFAVQKLLTHLGKSGINRAYLF